MTFDILIPRGEPLQRLTVSLQPGQCLFVLGANGAGKSALVTHITRQHERHCLRISAHRQTWLESSALAMSPMERANLQNNISSWNAQHDARWREHNPAVRPIVALYDLLDSQNVRARSIADAMERGEVEAAKVLAQRPGPIRMLNDLLRLCKIPISLQVEKNNELKASKEGDARYSVAEMSDGERNALLIAATVLTANDGMLVLLDEPERHLHRAVIVPLLRELIRLRGDCVFVIATHEPLLPSDLTDSRTLLLRGCRFDGAVPVAWDCDVLENSSTVDERTRTEILGARRKVLFVEGAASSLDQRLYSLLFPSVSVVGRESCRDVEQAVQGVRSSSELHWAKAWGLVDRDRRSEADLAALARKGVFATPFSSVESIYYHPVVQRHVAERTAGLFGTDPETAIASSGEAVLDAASEHFERLCRNAADGVARNEWEAKRPTTESFRALGVLSVTLNASEFLDRERLRLRQLIDARDVALIIGTYPIRTTGALNRIVEALGFRNRQQYESAVLSSLLESQVALQDVRSLFPELLASLES